MGFIQLQKLLAFCQEKGEKIVHIVSLRVPASLFGGRSLPIGKYYDAAISVFGVAKQGALSELT